MNCLIIAGGFNTRISQITKGSPKGLLEVDDQPIVAKLLHKALRLRSIDNFALVTNNQHARDYRQFLDSQPRYKKVQLINNGVNQNEDRLGAIGDILFALRKLRWDDDLLILPSDTLINLELPRLMQFFKYHQQITNVVTTVRDKSIIANSLGCVEMKKNQIISFEEKPAQPKTRITSVPIYIYPQKSQRLLLQYSEEGNNLDSPGAIMPWLLNKEQVLGFMAKNSQYKDIGTKESFQKISK